jgi:hypothetical protein
MIELSAGSHEQGQGGHAQIKSSLDAKLTRVHKLLVFPANPDEQKFLIDYFNAFFMLLLFSYDYRIKIRREKK